MVRYGLGVRIAGSHPAGPGSIPGNGIFSQMAELKLFACNIVHGLFSVVVILSFIHGEGCWFDASRKLIIFYAHTYKEYIVT